jgi:hypothetical protein
MSKRQVLWSVTCVGLGAALAGGSMWGFLRRAPRENISPAICYLQPNFPARSFAQVDGLLLNRETLPADLYNDLIRIEADSRARYESLAKQMAVRLDALGSAEKQVDPKTAPPIDSIVTPTASDSDAKKYFDSNPSSFPGVSFEKVKNLLKNMLGKQNADFVIQSKMSSIEKANRFHLLYPIPCGGKVDVPYSNTLPGRGSTTGNISLLYVFNYDCPQCRYQARDLDTFLNQNLASMRLWLMPVPGKEQSASWNFAAGLQCAFTQEAAKFMDFHKGALEVRLSDSGLFGALGKNSVLEVAEAAGYERKNFEECLTSKDTVEKLHQYRDFSNKYKTEGSPPMYFLNGRGMDPGLATGLVPTLKTILEESERLKNQLK